MRRAAYALINLTHLKKNLTSIRKIANHSKVMAVVKADAYGHGMLKVCQHLTDVDAFAVACVNEALELRDSEITKPILALQGFSTVEELQLAVAQKVQVVIHQSEQLKMLRNISHKFALDVYIKLDTGMHRLGFDPLQFKQIIAEIKSSLVPGSKVSVMTHLACADELNNPATQQQLDLFDQALNGQQCSQSIANSAGILAWPDCHRDWVRPGLMLYGVNPLNGDASASSHVDLRPVMSLRAPIISIKRCQQGSRIGYGGDYCCPHDMVMGVVAAGYADGYPRHLSNSPKLSIHGTHVPVVGRVSMDMITVDLTGVNAHVGDEVELWGYDISVTQVAKDAETISYELLCAAGNAVHRIFIE